MDSLAHRLHNTQSEMRGTIFFHDFLTVMIREDLLGPLDR